MSHLFTSSTSVVPDVLFRILDEGVALLNLKAEPYLGIDPVGMCTWKLLSEPPSIQHSRDPLLQEHEFEPARLDQDLKDFIDKLIERSWIELGAEELLQSMVSQ